MPSGEEGMLALRWRTFSHALAFVLGFSFVFVFAWGGAATLLGRLFFEGRDFLAALGGSVVVLMGLGMLGVRIPLLYPLMMSEWRPHLREARSFSYLTSGLMGVFFAAGWTPCVGPTLGAILTLTFRQETAGQALGLLAAYAIGLGLPFLAMGLLLDRALAGMRRMRRYLPAFHFASGMLLLLIGGMVLLDVLSRSLSTTTLPLWVPTFTHLRIWTSQLGLFLDVGPGAGLGYPVAFLAGLLSFFSPCVFPLVPAYLGYLSGRSLGGIHG
ncbi:cytochrome c biogenesis protein CcdA [Thermoflexus sp.]|uniref:cytochrome c biogenesis CcdA family protein n=1 Tax=Thermoflexus sp. TaxID=1969742 RepID=UPI0035E40B1B